MNVKKIYVMGLGVSSDVVPTEIESFRRAYSFNTGNLLFNFACGLLSSAPVVGRLRWNDSHSLPADVGLILPLANLLGPHFDFIERGPRIDGRNCPIIAIGLGAQFPLDQVNPDAVPEGTVQWLRDFTEGSMNGPRLGLRGEITKDVLARFDLDGVVLGCPSLFINPSVHLGREIESRIAGLRGRALRVSVAAGNPMKPQFLPLERSLISMVEAHDGDYVVQHPRALIELAHGWSSINPTDLLAIQRRLFPGLHSEDVKAWFRRRARVYVSVPQWLLSLRSSDIVVGTRIHGIQAALQAGVPAVCFYIDSRTRELCETMRVPCLPASERLAGTTVQDIIGILERWDSAVFDENRTVLAERMVNFLEKNSFPASSHLRRLAYL